MTEDRDSSQGRGAELGLRNLIELEDGSDVGFEANDRWRHLLR